MEQLKFKVGAETLVLHGEGLSAPLRGCLRRPAADLDGDHCREQLDLVLEGGRRESRSFLSRLQGMITRLEAGVPAVLEICPAAGEPLYESRVLGGQFTWLVGSIQPRGIGLRLELERENFWCLPWQVLPLHQGGAASTEPQPITNRNDGLGINQVFYNPGAENLGDLPTPLRLLVINDPGTAALGAVFCGQVKHEQPLATLEGEAAASDVVLGTVLDAASSAGAYGRLLWTGDEPVRLLTWGLADGFGAELAGKPLLPFVRFPEPPQEDLSLWWQIYQGGLVSTSHQERPLLGADWCRLPTVTLPEAPADFPGGSALTLVLWGQANGPTEHSLAVDMISFLGGEGWTALLPLPDGQTTLGETLIVNPGSSLAWSRTPADGALRTTHQVTGPGLIFVPGQGAGFAFFLVNETGTAVGQTAQVQLWLRPRVRVIP